MPVVKKKRLAKDEWMYLEVSSENVNIIWKQKMRFTTKPPTGRLKS